MALIIQIDADTYETDNGRGTSLRLIRRSHYWEVQAMNRAVKAYRSLGTSVYHTLEEVERRYKALRGITALIETKGEA